MEQHLTDNELIERCSKELKLSSIRDRVEDMVAEAAAGEWDYRTFLRTVLQREVEQRYENRKYARIRKAGFPQLKYLHELVREDLPPESRAFLPPLRTGSRSIIVTTNLPFTRWEEIMKDKVLCSALVDRLCHKAHLVNMTGKSYRLRETQKLYENLF